MTRLWLSVTEFHDGPGYGHPHELWWKDVTFEHAPSVGQRYYFIRSEDERDDGVGGVDIEVRNMYWATSGALHIELRRIVHLPNEKWEADFEHRFRSFGGDTESYLRQCPMPWRKEDDDPPLNARLVASGWHRWAELRDGQ